MADLRIADAPEIDESEVQGGLKIPTGGFGNKAINMTTVASWVVKDKDLPSKGYVDDKFNQGNQGLSGHVANKNNPHQVTKEQVGLGNVDNTADADKPISNATSVALNLKADKSQLQGLATTTQLDLKADKSTTCTKTEVDGVVDDLYQSLEDNFVANGAALPYDPQVTYNDGAVVNDNGTLKVVEGGNLEFAVKADGVQVGDSTLDVFAGDIKTKLYRDVVSVMDFGAKGDDDQTLYETNYQSDNASAPTTITQQTADGLAFNRAIKWLRNRGGGALYIPSCESGKSYRVWGYLERIDFPCVIYGAGAASLIKSCDASPTDKNGYGIFHIEPASVTEVTFMNFKVDGNAYTRTKPTSEWRSYNIHVCGKPQLRLFNITSVNSPIDCFCTRYKRPLDLTENEIVWVKVVNCHFEDSYRNTISLVAGNNIEFVNCHILGGGFVHGGTNPRYCLDIEPTSGDPRYHALNIKFTNCTFARAINVIIAGTWGQADFVGCTIDASYEHPDMPDKVGYPWAFGLSSLGSWTLKSCKVIGKTKDKSTNCVHYNAYDEISDFSENGSLSIYDTEFEYCGFNGNGRKLIINNVHFKNSLRPFAIRKGTLVPQGDVTIRGLTLTNVFENTTGSGTNASFVMANAHVGNIDIDDVKIIVDSKLLVRKFIPSDFLKTTYSGFTANTGLNNCASNGFLAKASNIYIEGYYKRLKNFAFEIITGDTRDWGAPNLPPANTDLVLSSVTATVSETTATGTATQNNGVASRTIGGSTTVTWKDCLMWGDFD